MIDRKTFKNILTSVVDIEIGIEKLEAALNCHFDQNWMTQVPCQLINTAAAGFFDGEINEDEIVKYGHPIEIVEELLYHFIYMEDCGNDSEHCKSKLIIVNEGKEDQHPIPCTNLDELYDAIITYIESTDADFSFNYSHSFRDEEE